MGKTYRLCEKYDDYILLGNPQLFKPSGAKSKGTKIKFIIVGRVRNVKNEVQQNQDLFISVCCTY